MNKLFFSFVLFLLCSCSLSRLNQPKSESDFNENIDGTLINVDPMDKIESKDSIVLIRLSKDVSFNWNNQTFTIVEDALWNQLLLSYEDNCFGIAHQIVIMDETPAKACGIERNLVLGDLAFIVIDKVESLPYFEAYGVQWDALDATCRYPQGMLDYIKRYREEIRDKTQLYLKAKKR